MRDLLVRDASRFGLAGVANTILTLAVYQLALFAIPAGPSYALAWVVGLSFVLLVYPSMVFPGGRAGCKTRVMVAISYASVFAVGLGVVQLSAALSAERIGVVVAMVATSVANFVAMRTLLRR